MATNKQDQPTALPVGANTVTIDRATAEILLLDARGYRLLTQCTAPETPERRAVIEGIDRSIAALESALAAGGE